MIGDPLVIHAHLFADDQEIGSVVAMRLNPEGEPADDDVCTYAWTVELSGQPDRSSDDRGTVEHRHGDGPWVLVADVIEKATPA